MIVRWVFYTVTLSALAKSGRPTLAYRSSAQCRDVA